MEYKQQRPPWRSTEGLLREKTAEKTKDGQPHLTGYRSSDKRESLAPREAARLGGSYGDVAVGVNRKKEITVVASKKRNKNGPSARREERELQADSAVQVNRARADFRTNSARKKSSALAYREGNQKPPIYLMERLRELMDSHEQDALREQLPFLDQKSDRQRLQRLGQEADTARAKGADPRALEREKQELQQILSEKTAQENRLRLTLLKAQEASHRMAGEAEMRRGPIWPDAPLTEAVPGNGEEAVEPGEEPDEEDSEQPKKENA